MHLTPQQRASVRAAAMADATASTFIKNGDVYSLLMWLNAPKTPTALAWRTSAPSREVGQAPSYTNYDTLVAGKRDSWRLFLSDPRDFTLEKVRAWVVDVWGKATAGSNAAFVLMAGTEPVTNVQAAIGGAMQQTDSVSALVRLFDGQIDMEDASEIASQGASPAVMRV